MKREHDYMRRGGWKLLLPMILTGITDAARAALPAPVIPPGAPSNGVDMIAVGQGFFQQGSQALMLVFGVVLCLVAAIAVVYKFILWRQDRAELSDLGTVALVGAGVVVMDLYMLNQATGIRGGTTTNTVCSASASLPSPR